MLKLLPARGPKVLFKAGDVVKSYRGANLVGEVRFRKNATGNLLEAELIVDGRTWYTINDLSSEFSDKYIRNRWSVLRGTALYLEVSFPKIKPSEYDMLKLLPVGGARYTFKEGDVIQVRRGNSTSGVLKFSESSLSGFHIKVSYYQGSELLVTTDLPIRHSHQQYLRQIWWNTLRGTAFHLEAKVKTKEPTAQEVEDFNNAMNVIASGEPKFSHPIFTGQRWSAKDTDGKVLNIIVNSKVNVTAGLPNAEHQLYNVCLRRGEVASYVHISHLSYIDKIDLSTVLEGANRYAPNGAKAIPEVDEDAEVGSYIVWCPTSEHPPRVILTSGKQARAVSHSMAERHGTKFYWAKLMGHVERKAVTTYENVVTVL